jgi:hypothetical protein
MLKAEPDHLGRCNAATAKAAASLKLIQATLVSGAKG